MDLLFILFAVFVWMLISWISSRATQKLRRASREGDPTGAPAPGVPSRPRPTRRQASRPERSEPKTDVTEPETQPKTARRDRDRPRRKPSRSRAPRLLEELDGQSLVRGVVMSEILGPPRSMKPYRSPWFRE